MSDSARKSDAWVVTPDAYLDAHPPKHPRSFRRSSQYVAAGDGTRLALDVYLPSDASATDRFPTVLLFTPYYRRFKVREPHPPTVLDAPNCGHYRDFFVPQGYAVVVVDVRGTGASFGARTGFRSPLERDDARDVADWVVRQGWCSGAIGSTGISYVGAAADFLATTGHPAVKAVMPTFSVWDTYGDHFYPGGLYMTKLASGYGRMADALDLDQRDVLRGYVYFADPHLEGPAPVDDDADGTLLRQAIDEHRANFDMIDFMGQLDHRDAALAHDPGFTSASISPYHYAGKIRPGLAHYGVSGWMDGAGYSNGTIERWLSLRNKAKRFILGPWDHGARTHVSPYRRAMLPDFKLLAEMLRFFDHHLKGLDNGLARERPIHYFTLVEERWKAADTWPPPEAKPVGLYLDAGNRLAPRKPAAAGKDDYRVDPGFGSGLDTRHERLSARAVETYYKSWSGKDATLLCYTGAPLDADTEVTGHPVVTLHLATTERDGALFVYLEDVHPDGKTEYVTEGAFRLRHRKLAAPWRHLKVIGPFHSFRKRDAALMTPGKPEEIAFALLPVSWLFRRGHRIRVAISGVDRDHYSRVTMGRIPTLTVQRGGRRASRIELPIVKRG